MTTFTGPLKVKGFDVETTVMEVTTTGKMSLGVTSPGRVMEVQRTSVDHTASAAVSIAHVPLSDITNIEIHYNATLNASADTLAGTVHLGTSALGDEAIAAIGLSSRRIYSIHDYAASAAALAGVSGTITAKVTGAGSASNPNGGSFQTYVHYLRR